MQTTLYDGEARDYWVVTPPDGNHEYGGENRTTVSAVERVEMVDGALLLWSTDKTDPLAFGPAGWRRCGRGAVSA